VEASGRPVHVIDAVTEAPRNHMAYFSGYLLGLSLGDIVKRIPAEATAVGLSCIFTHEWPTVAHLIELIRRARPPLMTPGDRQPYPTSLLCVDENGLGAYPHLSLPTGEPGSTVTITAVQVARPSVSQLDSRIP
jgi:hypothetical protein